MKHIATYALAMLACLSCSDGKEEKEIADVAASFARDYFGCKYTEARQLCTDSSEKWIKFVASNVSDSDLTVLNSAPSDAEFEVTDVDLTGDSTATASIEARNYLKLDAITRHGELSTSDTYRFTIECHNGKWMVHLDGVPQPEAE